MVFVCEKDFNYYKVVNHNLDQKSTAILCLIYTNRYVIGKLAPFGLTF